MTSFNRNALFVSLGFVALTACSLKSESPVSHVRTLSADPFAAETVANAPSNFQWSERRDELYFLRGDGIWIYHPEAQEEGLVVSREGAPENVDFGSFRVSPHESNILFSGKESKGLFVFNFPAREWIVLNENDETSLARFSPDGNRVAFVKSNNLFVQDTATASPAIQLTFDGSKNILNGSFDWVYGEEFGSSQGWQFSPDGTSIAFWRLDQTDVPEYPYYVDYTSPHPKISWMKYPKAGDTNSKVKIGLINLTNKSTSWVNLGANEDIYAPRLNWHTNSKSIYVQRLNRLQSQLDLLRYDIDTGETKTLLTETDAAWINPGDFLFINASKQIAWTSERDGFNHIYLLDENGQLVRQLTIGKWPVGQVLNVNSSGTEIRFTANRDSVYEQQTYKVFVGTGDIQRVTQQSGFHSGVKFSPSQKYFLSSYSRMKEPSRVILSNEQGELKRNFAEPTIVAGVEYSYFQFKNSNGDMLNGLMRKPTNFDSRKRYPVVLYVYGGPGVQVVTASPGGKSEAINVELVKQGYLVVSVDNRGTPGRGRDFERAIYRNLGDLEARDQLDAVRYLGGLSYIDASRVGVWGWSYGGYMTTMLTAKGGALFKAGVSVAPVTNWTYYDSIYTERFMARPVDNPLGYQQSATATHIATLSAKLLMVHGTADDNVHFQNTDSFLKVLLDHKKPFETLVFPNRNHGIGNSSFDRELLSAEILRFMKQSL